MLVALLGACAEAPPPPPAVAPAPAEPAPSPVEVLYRGAWPDVFVTLVAVDARGERALLELSSTTDERFAFEVVDLVEGQRVERWEASRENAPAWTPSGNAFAPLDGSFEGDLARLGRLLVPFGPWTLDGWPPIAVSPDGARLAYTHEDRLRIARDDGTTLRELDQTASYQPVFSPDGARLAWIGCVDGCAKYDAWVATLTGPPRRIETVNADALRPFWSPDGRHVYVQDRQIPVHEHGRVCLLSAPVDGDRPSTPQAIACLDDVTNAGLAIDPSGARAVLAGWPSEGDDGHSSRLARYVVVQLPAGPVLWTADVAQGGVTPFLTSRGWILTGVGGQHEVLDPATGRRARVEGASTWFGAREVEGDLVALRRTMDREERTWRWEIVRIDLDAVAL